MSGGAAGGAERTTSISQTQRDEIRAALNIIRDLRSAADDSMEVERSDETAEAESDEEASGSAVAGSAVTRKGEFQGWKKFCSNVRRKSVQPTCVIDFPYGDDKGLKLAGDNRLLERMYCFKDAENDTRVVLHVHTILEWGNRRSKTPSQRAQRVTSVNVRHAVKEAKGFKQEGGAESYHVLPGRKLRKEWRGIFKKGRGKTLEWEWATSTSMPLSEDTDSRTREAYNEVCYPRPSFF